MQVLRIQVKPLQNGRFSIRVQARDDAGHILDSWVESPNNSSVGEVVADAIKSLQMLASEYTEEEQFNEKS